MSHLVHARITGTSRSFNILLADLQGSTLVNRAQEVADLRSGIADDSSSAGLSEAAAPKPRYVEIEFADRATAEDIEDIAVRAPRVHDVAFEILDRPEFSETIPETGHKSRG